jgi:hypothetical protein
MSGDGSGSEGATSVAWSDGYDTEYGEDPSSEDETYHLQLSTNLSTSSSTLITRNVITKLTL